MNDEHMGRFYVLISASGAVTVGEFSKCVTRLDELQTLVKGYIETVNARLGDNMIMLVNEEGMINSLPINHTASELYHSALFGDAVICGVRGEDIVGLNERTAVNCKMLLDVWAGGSAAAVKSEK